MLVVLVVVLVLVVLRVLIVLLVTSSSPLSHSHSLSLLTWSFPRSQPAEERRDESMEALSIAWIHQNRLLLGSAVPLK